MSNWRIVVLCVLVAVLVAAVMRYDRNRGRFVPTSNFQFLLDTRTGQYCDALGMDSGFPKCGDLAKRWW